MELPPIPTDNLTVDRNNLDRFIARNPANPIGPMLLGALLHRASDYSGAIEAYKQAIALARADLRGAVLHEVKALEAMGLAYRELSNQEEMVACWKDAIRTMEAIPRGREAIVALDLYEELTEAVRLGSHPRL